MAISFALPTFAQQNAKLEQKPPTIILPIGPGEELFNSEHEKFIEEFKALDNVLRADANLIVIITLRSDGFAKLQNSPEFSESARVPFDLPRLSPSAFKEAIEGPGRLGDPPIQFEPALIDKLTADLNTPDALPPLAFTLQRLIASPADDGLITLNDYEVGLGGLKGAIDIAVEDAFKTAMTDPILPKERGALAGLVPPRVSANP